LYQVLFLAGHLARNLIPASIVKSMLWKSVTGRWLVILLGFVTSGATLLANAVDDVVIEPSFLASSAVIQWQDAPGNPLGTASLAQRVLELLHHYSAC
jgi:hypothetical protein